MVLLKIRSALSRQGIGVRLRERDEFVFPRLIRQNVVSQTGQEKQAKVMNTDFGFDATACHQKKDSSLKT